MSANISHAEQRIRRGLSVIRWMTGYVPMTTFRWLNDLTLGAARIPAGVTTAKTTIAGRPAEWFRAAESESGPVVLYLHGGGFIMPAAVLHRTYCGNLAKHIGGSVLMIDYRLAPEHPFPAAVDDSLAAYQALLANGVPAERLIVAGDSAGGNLTLALLQALKQSGDPMPACAVAISPVADMSRSRDEDPAAKTDEMLHPRALQKFHASYIRGSDGESPLASPVLGDLSGLPPTLIFAGERELLCGDAVRYTDAAAKAGSPVTLCVEPRLWHVWPLNYPELPQAVDAMAQVAAFVREHAAVPV
ncbi:MAG: alpha/beta hydrolase [Chloroflexi bacterium]|nr:alpha/beta hydrolase [Chloroflexota bacterium]